MVAVACLTSWYFNKTITVTSIEHSFYNFLFSVMMVTKKTNGGSNLEHGHYNGYFLKIKHRSEKKHWLLMSKHIRKYAKSFKVVSFIKIKEKMPFVKVTQVETGNKMDILTIKVLNFFIFVTKKMTKQFF